MKRLTTSGMALAISLAASSTTVFAQSQLENTVQNMLTEYGYEVDASTLTDSQLTALSGISDDEATTAEVRSAIEGVITPDFETMAVEAPQLRERADQLFAEYDVEAAPNRLSLNQLSALSSVENGVMSDDEARATIHSIIGEAPDMAQIDVMTEPQLAALAQVKFNEYGVDIDASALDRNALVAVLAVDETEMDTYAETVAALESAAGV